MKKTAKKAMQSVAGLLALTLIGHQFAYSCDFRKQAITNVEGGYVSFDGHKKPAKKQVKQTVTAPSVVVLRSNNTYDTQAIRDILKTTRYLRRVKNTIKRSAEILKESCESQPTVACPQSADTSSRKGFGDRVDMASDR